jgi:hypothetical protein
VILDIATSIADLEDWVKLQDPLSGDLQVACLETRCSRDMDTVDIHSTDILLTGIRHMAINRMGITVLINNENTLSNRISDCLACFLIHLSDCKNNDDLINH